MDLIERGKAQDAVFSEEDIKAYMDGVGDGDINETMRSAIRLIEMVPPAFEGMTNGQVIQALWEVQDITMLEVCVFVDCYPNVQMRFDKAWWNAPYNSEREDEE